MTFSKQSTIATLEEDLSSLWKSSEELEKTHACLFNLIVYTKSETRAAYFKELLDSLMEKFPCRVLFIQICDDFPPETLKVEVRMECVGKATGELVSCDFIDIQCALDQVPKIPYLLLPHFVPDLPVYLLWGEDPTIKSPLLSSLHSLVTRIIFDGACVKDLKRFSHEMPHLIEAGRPDYVDMNWVQLTGWREILLQTLDNQERVEELTNARSIKLIFNTHSITPVQNTEAQALYLFAWLAARLKWVHIGSKKLEDGYHSRFAYQDREIKVRLIPQMDDTLGPGEIIKLDISTWNDHFYLFIRKEHQFQVSVNISSLETCELPLTLPLTHSNHGFRFWREIFYQQMSDHYREMLEVLKHA